MAYKKGSTRLGLTTGNFERQKMQMAQEGFRVLFKVDARRPDESRQAARSRIRQEIKQRSQEATATYRQNLRGPS